MADPVSEAVGGMFMDSVMIAMIALVIVAVIIVLIISFVLIPKPYGWVVALISLLVAAYLIFSYASV